MDALGSHAPGQGWLAILARPTFAEFARAFGEAPVLEASVLAESIRGVQGVRAFFQATRAMYERIAFTSEHRADSSTWLEWQGQYLGAPISGLTILTDGADGAIVSLRILCLPLAQLSAFAAELQLRLNTAPPRDPP